jgi:hypothetical protein
MGSCETAVIVNPSTKKPIGPGLFANVFADEIRIGRLDADAVVAKSMLAQIKKGNTVLTIWYTKNMWGWRDQPEATKPAPNSDEYAKTGSHTLRLIVTGGLPPGSTPEKPEGDNYSDVPPEAAAWTAQPRRSPFS